MLLDFSVLRRLSMKHFISLLAVSLLFSLSTSGAFAEESRKATIAVFDFGLEDAVTRRISETSEHRDRATATVRYETSLLRDRFVTALTRMDNITVVERGKLAQIMEEAQLSQTDIADPDHAMELGKLLGADYLLFGTMSIRDASIEHTQLPYNAGRQTVMKHVAGANIRIVRAETGEVVAAESTRVENKETFLRETIRRVPETFKQDTYDMLVDKMVRAAMSEIFPVMVAAYSDEMVYLNHGRLQAGDRMRVFQPGDEIIDPASGRVLGVTEREIAVIEITEGLENFSKAQVVEWRGEAQEISVGSICRIVEE